MGKDMVPPREEAVEEIAVIGLAGRFPGAKDVNQFWQNLRDGVESIIHFTDQELEAQGIPSEWLKDPDYVKAGTVLEDFDKFDAMFFGYSPKEAENIDPQQRIFLETAWEALENAGYNPENYDGPIGVFAGSNPNDYLEILPAHSDAKDSAGALEKLIGNEKDFLCTRVSYKFNLRGPSITVQTGCSTSLVAVQLACQSLLNYQCNIALAGGVSINLRHNRGYFYQEGMIPSPDGHCRAFDADARGTVLSQGVGVVVLKRLSEALSDGDTIHAVIKGIAINNDGALKAGYTAPSVDGQAQVIAMAYALSGVTADTISYIETHGTATPLGDPIEIAALTQAFRASTQKKGFCAIGSVKTNIGHADAASGIAGLIKTILMLKHKQIPPSLHFNRPNPNIDFEKSPFYVPTKPSEWPDNGFPRRAGVSSFGLGGTNVHAVLEEVPTPRLSGRSRPWQLLLISGQTSNALEKATTNLVEHLKNNPRQNLSDVAYTLSTGRKVFNYRRMVVCKDRDDAIRSLETPNSGLALNSYQEPVHRDVVFMFSGQGSQYVNMGLELYRTESVFREHMDQCSKILRSHLSLDLRDILYPEKGNIEELAQQLRQTSITQPALFTVEYALAKLWMSWGVHPAAMVGHSIGEYVAACLSGVFSLEDALFLVATRGRLIQQLPAGSMLAVQLPEKDIERFLNQRLSLAAVNAPSFCVVSGEKEAVRELENALTKSNVAFTPLHTSHAFHSKMMEAILDAFKKQVGQVRVGPPQIPFLSNLTGTWITSEEAMSPSYWARHLRQTVRFSSCVQELLKDPNRIFLEVGPGHTLSTFVRQHSDGSKGRVVLCSLRHPKEEKSDVAFILNTLGRLWLAGVQVDWSGFYKDEQRQRMFLPTYPFERQRYWVQPVEQPRGFFASQAALTKMGDSSQCSIRHTSQSGYLAPRSPDLKNDFVPPRNDVERAISGVWQKLLGIQQISIHDNFFDLGGTSLTAARLFAQIETIFGKKLTPTSLYESQTVEQLSKLLSDTPSSSIHAGEAANRYRIIPANLSESKQNIIDLWKRNFQNITEERYPWIYEQNPFGPATCLLAKDTKQDSVIGLTALFPRRVAINGKYHLAGLGGDFAVNKEHRRVAPALLLQNAAISKCNEGEFDFLYGFPNKESEPVDLMLGFKMFDVLRMTKPLRSYYYLKNHFNSPAVARMISRPIDLAIKIFSKETRYKRHGGFKAEMLSSFDGMFDKLWEEASTRFAIIGERSSSYLNWRYVRSPYNKHCVFVLRGNGNGNILGYIVFHIIENRTYIDDILCFDMDETLDSLLSQFLLFERKEGVDSVSISYTGTQLLVKKLQEFGFSIRDKEGKAAIYVPLDSPLTSCLVEKENWYLMPGDNDI